MSSLTCPNLRKLRLLYGGEEKEQEKRKDGHKRVDQLEFVRQCQGSLLSLVVIHGWNDPRPALEAAWACPSLESLTLVGTYFSKSQDLRRYWGGLWSRLTHLCLREFDFGLPVPYNEKFLGHGNSSNESQREPLGVSYFEGLKGTMGRIKVLQLLRVGGLEDDLLFLMLCPDLETLVWNPVKNHRGLEHLTKQARQCPKLANFHSNTTSGDDDQTVARFIESRTSISTALFGAIALDVNWLSETSWELLKEPLYNHHLLTLRVLELRSRSSATDKIIQEIFCSLPNLEDFSAPRLQEEEILRDPRPWICRKLYRLVLEIVPSRGSSAQTMLLDRIAGLICLETLDLRGPAWQNNESNLQALIFRLDCGLDRLRPLQNLTTLDLGIMIQDWTEKDVEWIVENWPRLRRLRGVRHHDRQKEKILAEMLRDGGVNVSVDAAVIISDLDP